ncbi:MAG: YHS domain-containing (seleno)protein [Candidatus Methylacidiphilales bacterium]
MKNKILITVFSLISIMAFSQTDFNVRKKHFNLDKNNLAIQGYDPISYFEGTPQKGNALFLTFYKGVQYYFTSQAHKDLFLKTPEKYEPAYGGWCAYAMGEYGDKVEIDPTSYKIVNGKLNLFYYSFINKTLNKWNLDEANLKAKAYKNWELTVKK